MPFPTAAVVRLETARMPRLRRDNFKKKGRAQPCLFGIVFGVAFVVVIIVYQPGWHSRVRLCVFAAELDLKHAVGL